MLFVALKACSVCILLGLNRITGKLTGKYPAHIRITPTQKDSDNPNRNRIILRLSNFRPSLQFFVVEARKRIADVNGKQINVELCNTEIFCLYGKILIVTVA